MREEAWQGNHNSGYYELCRRMGYNIQTGRHMVRPPIPTERDLDMRSRSTYRGSGTNSDTVVGNGKWHWYGILSVFLSTAGIIFIAFWEFGR
jgi:hypothetical protein